MPSKKLYRFISIGSEERIEWAKDIFYNKQLYFSSPDQFNDPFDCYPCLAVHEQAKEQRSYLEELYKNQRPSSSEEEIERFVNEKIRLIEDPEFLQKFWDEFYTIYGIFCLSDTCSEILLWSHYSDSHKGFCLVIENDPESEYPLNAKEVKYTNIRPAINLMKRDFDEVWRILLIKAKSWEYEREYRVISAGSDRGPGKYPFEPKILSSVIFGAKMTDDHKKMVLGWVSDYPTEIKVYQARLDDKEYKIVVEPYSQP